MKCARFEIVNPKNANNRYLYVFSNEVVAVEDSAKSGCALIYMADGRVAEVNKSAASVMNELQPFKVFQE